MSSAVRSTALRAGGACVRCRKGKTKCVYDNGRAPCKNCAKGMHECYLPSESMSHGGHGVSPARVQHRVRDSLPSERIVSGVAGDRQGPPASAVSRHVSSTNDKYVPFHPSPARSFATALRLFLFFWSCSHPLHSLFPPPTPPPPQFFLTGSVAGRGAGRLLCAISGRCALPPLRGLPRVLPARVRVLPSSADHPSRRAENGTSGAASRSTPPSPKPHFFLRPASIFQPVPA